MSQGADIPEAGYALERVYFGEQVLRIVRDEIEFVADDQESSFSWDWRFQDEQAVEVLLRVGIGPSRGRPEEIRAAVSGVFRLIGRAPTVELQHFVRFNGPAILMPFVRECIATMTARGFFGQILLPPFNVHALMQGMNPELTTGAKQLATKRESATLPAGPMTGN
jgi:preprotein translocase subunit SecB